MGSSAAILAVVIVFAAAISGISGFIAYKFGLLDWLFRRNPRPARSPSSPTPPIIPIPIPSARPTVAPLGGFWVVMGPMGLQRV